MDAQHMKRKSYTDADKQRARSQKAQDVAALVRQEAGLGLYDIAQQDGSAVASQYEERARSQLPDIDEYLRRPGRRVSD
jgi:hypothetical protein